jgi:hypothetical protein
MVDMHQAQNSHGAEQVFYFAVSRVPHTENQISLCSSVPAQATIGIRICSRNANETEASVSLMHECYQMCHTIVGIGPAPW